jgi:rfaE bifunctional protein kinase chain/domain/rfaE bifunctional protein nucleotidyltransferase chain/domain
VRDAMRRLEGARAPRALVMGDVMLDRYTWGDATRVSPEAPVLVLRSDLDEVRPGGAASVAYLLRGLEAQVTLAGIVGDDADGRILRRLLDESGIDRSLVFDDPCRVTTSKERIIGRSANHPHQLVRVDREDGRGISHELEDRLLVAIMERLPEHNVLVISDYGKGCCSRRLLATIILAAANRNIPTLVDPARGVDYAGYRRATLLKPNRPEAQIATGVPIRTANDALIAGRLLREQCRVENVLITLDAEGMALVAAGGRGELIATRPRQVCDVTGAGDMVLAMLGLCRAAGLDWSGAACLANVAAGLEVERFGVAPISRAELATALEAEDLVREDGLPSTSHRAGDGLGRPSSDEGRDEGVDSIGNALRGVPESAGPLPCPSAFAYDALTRPCGDNLQFAISPRVRGRVVSLDQLLPIVGSARANGRTMVFTNGCFDLLHVGHLRCLQKAARLGDVLIVAVNSDDSVRRLKGKNRPVVKEAHRATMIAALGCVDYVTIFAEDTPHELLRAIQPDVLVKGGTCAAYAVEGADLVTAQGGQVRVTGRVRGVSTTDILKRIHSRRTQ